MIGYNRVMVHIEGIQREAAALGFDAVGATDAGPVDPRQAACFRSWLAAGRGATMDWLGRHIDKRLNPAALLDGARSVIVAAMNYKPRPHDDGSDRDKPPAGRVAQYACYDDYHVFMKDRLRALAQWLSTVAGGHRFRVCVDSAPLTERALAERAGVGFIGRNHMLISHRLGPQIFLGEIITTVDVAGAAAQTPRRSGHPCGDCRRCIDACPTGALSGDGEFDARRCISYLTIEHKGPMEPALADLIGDHLFGCDECVLACPYRDLAPARVNNGLAYHSQRAYLSLDGILRMSEDMFERQFAGSVLIRCGLQGLQRNARICLANVHRAPRCQERRAASAVARSHKPRPTDPLNTSDGH